MTLFIEYVHISGCVGESRKSNIDKMDRAIQPADLMELQAGIS